MRVEAVCLPFRGKLLTSIFLTEDVLFLECVLYVGLVCVGTSVRVRVRVYVCVCMYVCVGVGGWVGVGVITDNR